MLDGFEDSGHRHLNVYNLSLGSSLNYLVIDLGSLSSVFIPSMDFLGLLSPKNEIELLGIKSSRYNSSNETTEARMAKTFPLLQHLEIVSYKHQLCWFSYALTTFARSFIR